MGSLSRNKIVPEVFKDLSEARYDLHMEWFYLKHSVDMLTQREHPILLKWLDCDISDLRRKYKQYLSARDRLAFYQKIVEGDFSTFNKGYVIISSICLGISWLMLIIRLIDRFVFNIQSNEMITVAIAVSFIAGFIFHRLSLPGRHVK